MNSLHVWRAAFPEVALRHSDTIVSTLPSQSQSKFCWGKLNWRRSGEHLHKLVNRRPQSGESKLRYRAKGVYSCCGQWDEENNAEPVALAASSPGFHKITIEAADSGQMRARKWHAATSSCRNNAGFICCRSYWNCRLPSIASGNGERLSSVFHFSSSIALSKDSKPMILMTLTEFC